MTREFEYNSTNDLILIQSLLKLVIGLPPMQISWISFKLLHIPKFNQPVEDNKIVFLSVLVIIFFSVVHLTKQKQYVPGVP